MSSKSTPSKVYRIKEAFYTLQGEGTHAGRPSVFCRFSKCNLWNGKEDGRASASCQFCDTDFVGTDGQNGGRYSQDELCSLLRALWPASDIPPYIVCTGGEPALQLDEDLIEAMHQQGFEIAIETNGTLPLPANIDWICLSPKENSQVVLQQCDELKLVYPQPGAMPEQFEHIKATHRYLQPMDMTALQQAPKRDHIPLFSVQPANPVQAAVSYCLANPQWKLSTQTHKWIGID
ncbi:7-carboxy-7-deazaguanine synthase [Oceanobacter sp. 3_MG-2023]|uniref:7-carboxy-7-deazaguanine synthase n=1 Tax=Oceanobacter sp. 3_MG-2023 TaxID=3062622 RepID=UPI002733CE84|nr:7-carboxy-7-deazaguanine synthase [Oceanobacter sp. 3_MG-2023]MDP2506747.1 7-carboxy-7-deazaguanine synthase [Oceanobacter sp. 3_MG-2023]